ncbi:hypothetical protein M1523_02265 [Patescibacteria group bacterium]|nr:hypothetical protein [Patescibacteria group bacterium]MCL5091455.1 hypothetical protein [Patescibacteria group bacterium]
MRKTVKTHWLITAFLIFYFSITAFKFIAHPTPFYDWDEGIYAQVGKEMIARRSLVPLWQGQAWLDKPPLVPLFYGLVEQLPVPAEYSLRFATLAMALLALVLLYAFVYRTLRQRIIPTLTVIITAFIPMFVQRAQVLNVDVFLLIGWLGYVIAYPNFWWSLMFLSIGVLSKSLLGYFPALMLLTYELWQLRRPGNKSSPRIRNILIQIGITGLWFVAMIWIYRGDFIRAHFIESQLKRVTASIESHFGQRTFYLEQVWTELGLWHWLLPVGLAAIAVEFWQKRNVKRLFWVLFFTPWFIFLNLTKTKITWYLYVIVPQFALIVACSVAWLKNRKLILIAATLIGLITIKVDLVDHQFFLTHYSQPDDNYQMAIAARSRCGRLGDLVSANTRSTYTTLKEMNLVIGSTRWWGDHPSIVYYFGKPVEFLYSIDELQHYLDRSTAGDCLAIETNNKTAVASFSRLTKINQFGALYLYQVTR